MSSLSGQNVSQERVALLSENSSRDLTCNISRSVCDYVDLMHTFCSLKYLLLKLNRGIYLVNVLDDSINDLQDGETVLYVFII